MTQQEWDLEYRHYLEFFSSRKHMPANIAFQSLFFIDKLKLFMNTECPAVLIILLHHVG